MEHIRREGLRAKGLRTYAGGTYVLHRNTIAESANFLDIDEETDRWVWLREGDDQYPGHWWGDTEHMRRNLEIIDEYANPFAEAMREMTR